MTRTSTDEWPNLRRPPVSPERARALAQWQGRWNALAEKIANHDAAVATHKARHAERVATWRASSPANRRAALPPALVYVFPARLREQSTRLTIKQTALAKQRPSEAA